MGTLFWSGDIDGNDNFANKIFRSKTIVARVASFENFLLGHLLS